MVTYQAALNLRKYILSYWGQINMTYAVESQMIKEKYESVQREQGKGGQQTNC